MSQPTCNRCGSPWFEPEFGVLMCCDCGLEFGKYPRPSDEIKYEDFPCDGCKAPVGQVCNIRRGKHRAHAPRVDAYCVAWNRLRAAESPGGILS